MSAQQILSRDIRVDGINRRAQLEIVDVLSALNGRRFLGSWFSRSGPTRRQRAGLWTLLQPTAACGGLDIRSQWPTPLRESGVGPPRPFRTVGHGPRHRPSRPSKWFERATLSRHHERPAVFRRTTQSGPPGRGLRCWCAFRQPEPNPTGQILPLMGILLYFADRHNHSSWAR